jgi:hypothetical protein
MKVPENGPVRKLSKRHGEYAAMKFSHKHISCEVGFEDLEDCKDGRAENLLKRCEYDTSRG